MTGDIVLLQDGQFGAKGSRRYAVAASSTLIYPGEPVAKALGTSGSIVTPMATNSPQVGTHYLAGIATSKSTNTASAVGVVDVMPISPDSVFLIAPKVAATWDTQAEYDALVGARVLIDLTSSTYTILASDSSGNGCVIEPLDIAKYPGKVAFSFRGATRYNA